MYVCVCRAVTDVEVIDAIEAGADTVQAVTQACCAGEDCGTCHETIAGLIDKHSPNRRLPLASEQAA